MNKKVLVTAILFGSLTVSGIMSAQSVYPGQHQGKLKKETVAPLQAESFDLKDVRLLPSRFRDNMLRDSAWMTSIDVNRLLHSFRTNAGVFAGREGGYMTVKKLGGWESLDCELRGHTTGHMLSALGLMYAATGSEIFKLKGDSLVNGLEEVQNALKNGYLSAWPEELINRNIQGKGVWAPWYTLHKLFSGLIDQYLYADNKKALTIVTRVGDWAYNKLKPLSEETRKLMIRNEFGGINESFYNLYSITGDERYRWLAEYFYHNDVIDPLKELRDDLGTKHTNTFIPKVIAEARNYELTRNETSRKLSEFFWHTMIDHHTFAPGCSSDKEHYFDPKKLSQHLTGYTGETCCTYNMLKLSRHLFCWTGDSSIADYYERALYNHILGQQDPETGMVAYFLPLLSGSHKLYSTKENSFWCCVGSGFENHAKFGEAIYYHNNQGIYVNLFIPSQVTWKEKGLTIRQETEFPQEETTRFTLQAENPVRTTIYLRYPSWSKDVKVSVNGKKISVKQKSGSYIAITREWKDGDQISATYPMQIKLETTPDNPDKAALLYGPLVLAGERGTEGMQAPAPFSNPALYNDYYTYTFNAAFRVRSVAAYAIHKFFQENGFVYAHSPLLTASDCEGAGEMFRVTTLDLDNVPKNEDGTVDYTKDFFEKPVNLTVSGQLEAEAMAMAFGKVYTFGPTFRAEKSFTTRHAAEFWMIEPEMAFCDLNGYMDTAEAMTKYVIRYVLDNCPDEMAFFNQFIDKGLIERLELVANSEFGRISYTDAIEILKKNNKKFQFPVEWGVDIQTEHERYLTEVVFKKPVFVTDYPKEIKSFYMKQNADGKTVAAADMLVPGIGELIGGSQREEDYDKLVTRMDELGLDKSSYDWYLNLRKFGGVEHAGYGLGFERMIMYLTGIQNIRDVLPFPRTAYGF